MNKNQKIQGTVRYISEPGKYAIIEGDGVGYDTVIWNFPLPDNITFGTKVLFEVEITDKGFVARNVSLT